MKDDKNFMGGWDKVIAEQFKAIQTKGQTNEEYMQTCNTEELGCFICENFFMVLVENVGFAKKRNYVITVY